VKHWITFNEPRIPTWINYDQDAAESGVEPYINMHNLLLAHAEAVSVYNKSQNGNCYLIP